MVKKILTILLVIAMLFSLPVYASDVEITGTFSDKFELTSSDGDLFDIPIMNPGDVWTAELEIKNQTNNKMEVQLVEVLSKIDDNLLFDTLLVKVEIDGEVFYEGPYNKIPKSEWLPMEKDAIKTVKVTLSFPGDCGNEFQNKSFDSVWKFEARLPEGAPEKPVEPPVQTGVVRVAYISGLVCVGAFLLFLLIGKDKKKDDDDTK